MHSFEKQNVEIFAEPPNWTKPDIYHKSLFCSKILYFLLHFSMVKSPSKATFCKFNNLYFLVVLQLLSYSFFKNAFRLRIYAAFSSIPPFWFTEPPNLTEPVVLPNLPNNRTEPKLWSYTNLDKILLRYSQEKYLDTDAFKMLSEKNI